MHLESTSALLLSVSLILTYTALLTWSSLYSSSDSASAVREDGDQYTGM